MDNAKTVNLADTHANLVEDVHGQVSVDQSEGTAMLPQLHLMIEQFCEEVQIRLIFECCDESYRDLILSTIRQVVFDFVQSMLLHYNVCLLSFRLDIIH